MSILARRTINRNHRMRYRGCRGIHRAPSDISAHRASNSSKKVCFRRTARKIVERRGENFFVKIELNAAISIEVYGRGKGKKTISFRSSKSFSPRERWRNFGFIRSIFFRIKGLKWVSGKVENTSLEFGYKEGRKSSTGSFNPLLGSGYEEIAFSRARKIRDLSPSGRIPEESAFLLRWNSDSCQNIVSSSHSNL